MNQPPNPNETVTGNDSSPDPRAGERMADHGHRPVRRDAGYLRSEKSKNGTAPKTTTVSLTDRGRSAFDAYTQALRDLLGGL